MTLDAGLMRAVAGPQSGTRATSQAGIINAVGPVLAATLTRFEIQSPLRAAHFLAQCAHESDDFVTTVEYASGDDYNGRANLGNTQPGDGPRFKGRGLIQLTGRTNYQHYGDLLGIDLVDSPEKAADPATSLLIACQFWTLNGLNAFADKDWVMTITRHINGGFDGLADRKAKLVKAKTALGLSTAPAPMPNVLQVGSKGDPVILLQQALARAGYSVAPDGDFGPATAGLVKQFQQSRGMTADGVAGPTTRAALGM